MMIEYSHHSDLDSSHLMISGVISRNSWSKQQACHMSLEKQWVLSLDSDHFSKSRIWKGSITLSTPGWMNRYGMSNFLLALSALLKNGCIDMRVPALIFPWQIYGSDFTFELINSRCRQPLVQEGSKRPDSGMNIILKQSLRPKLKLSKGLICMAGATRIAPLQGNFFLETTSTTTLPPRLSPKRNTFKSLPYLLNPHSITFSKSSHSLLGHLIIPRGTPSDLPKCRVSCPTTIVPVFCDTLWAKYSYAMIFPLSPWLRKMRFLGWCGVSQTQVTTLSEGSTRTLSQQVGLQEGSSRSVSSMGVIRILLLQSILSVKGILEKCSYSWVYLLSILEKVFYIAIVQQQHHSLVQYQHPVIRSLEE